MRGMMRRLMARDISHARSSATARPPNTRARCCHTVGCRMSFPLARRRESGKDILQPTVWQHLALVFGGLAVALLLAWLMSRAMSRRIMPLIDAAHRIGSGNVSCPVDVPRDPDLAQLVVALNEM